MNIPFKVLIVDDHPMLAYGTKIILENLENVLVVGVAATGEKCMEYVHEFIPDLVLLDYNLPDQNGYELTKLIKAYREKIHVVIFTGTDIFPIYNELLDLDVSGILAKNASEDQLFNMIRSIMEEQTVIPLALFRQLRLNKILDVRGTLTDQEISIMSMVVEGFTQEQIADTIFASKRTVDNYLRKVYEKLGVKSRIQAVQKFIENKSN
jgi:two-component system competent response regulator ComA